MQKEGPENKYTRMPLIQQLVAHGRAYIYYIPAVLSLGRCGMNFKWHSAFLSWHIS